MTLFSVRLAARLAGLLRTSAVLFKWLVIDFLGGRVLLTDAQSLVRSLELLPLGANRLVGCFRRNLARSFQVARVADPLGKFLQISVKD